MTDYKTMRVPEGAYETAKAHKEQLGVTWGEYLTLPTDDGEVYGTGIDPEIVEQLQKMESTSELMDQLTRLDNRLDELPEQTAGKVQERLR